MVNPHHQMRNTLMRGLCGDVDGCLICYVLPMERQFGAPEIVRTGTALATWKSIRASITTVADMNDFEAEVPSPSTPLNDIGREIHDE